MGQPGLRGRACLNETPNLEQEALYVWLLSLLDLLGFKIYFIYYYRVYVSVCLCMCLCVCLQVCMPPHMCGGQRAVSRHCFFPLLWVLAIELGSRGLQGERFLPAEPSRQPSDFGLL